MEADVLPLNYSRPMRLIIYTGQPKSLAARSALCRDLCAGRMLFPAEDSDAGDDSPASLSCIRNESNGRPYSGSGVSGMDFPVRIESRAASRICMTITLVSSAVRSPLSTILPLSTAVR